MLSSLEKIGLPLMIFVLMLGMGATLTRKDFGTALKHPKGILIGMLSQFGIMPLLAFTIARIFQLPDLVAISLIMVGATPGGTTSNLFTYYSRGDVSLSISMTVASSIAAIIMMPLLVGLYVQGLDTNIQVPYAKIVATILIMLIPVIIGMTVRGKKPSAAKTLEKIGSYAGILIIVVLIGSFVSRERTLLASTPATVYGGIALLCFGGFAIGYLGSLLAKLSRNAARTVALETGIQNTPLTMAVIVASFPAEDHAALLVLPLIYAVSIVIYACVMTGIFRATNRAK